MPRPADPAVRTRLIEAAARLLTDHGRDAVTARRLASEVGASTQVLYTHFAGVDDLLAEVWREGFRRFGTALDSPSTTDDPVADWMVQGWEYRRFALDNRDLYLTMFSNGVLGMREGSPQDMAAAAATFASLLVRLERCVESGRWSIADLFTAGEVVWATVHGHMMIELHGYYSSLERDPTVTYSDGLRRTALSSGDAPDLVEASLKAARRRANRSGALRSARPQN